MEMLKGMSTTSEKQFPSPPREFAGHFQNTAVEKAAYFSAVPLKRRGTRGLAPITS
jgi:hypothetical protein